MATQEEIKNNNFNLSIPLYTKYRIENKIAEDDSIINNWYESGRKLTSSLGNLFEEIRRDTNEK